MSEDLRRLLAQATNDIETTGTFTRQSGLQKLWTLFDRPQLPQSIRNEAVQLLATYYQTSSEPRGLLTLQLFRNDGARALQAARGSNSPIDFARAYELRGAHSDASDAYAESGYFAHAAFQAEKAYLVADAVAHWKSFLNAKSTRLDPYTRALAMVNLSRVVAAGGDARAARGHMIEGIRLIESTAAQFDAMGMRERAFDCYQVLLSLGKYAAFENLSEGYLNSIRILRDDHLRTYVLQYYEDFQRIALERGEFQAAATLFREAAAYCRAQRLPYAQHYLKQAAEAHVSTAHAYEQKHASPEIVENAYLAAIDCFTELGLFARVRSVYKSLAALDLSEARKARYGGLVARLLTQNDEVNSITRFPDELKSTLAYPDVWRMDVLEWELDGDVAETMGDVLLDSSWPAQTRQAAMVCRLRAQSIGDDPSTKDRVALCAVVGATEIYPALALVERFARDEASEVRAAAMRTMQQLYFKRSFVTIRLGLADSVPAVRADAEKALAKLYFPHAFDPLRRIYREPKQSANIKQIVLRSVARIPTREAAEMLTDVAINERGAEASTARDLARESRNPFMDESLSLLAEDAAPNSPAAKALQEIIAARRPR